MTDGTLLELRDVAKAFGGLLGRSTTSTCTSTRARSSA